MVGQGLVGQGLVGLFSRARTPQPRRALLEAPTLLAQPAARRTSWEVSVQQVPGGSSEQQHLSHGLCEPQCFSCSFMPCRAQGDVDGGWGAGGTASLMLQQFVSGLKVQISSFSPSLSSCFRAAELYLDYFPNLLFTALRPRGLFLQERGEFYVFG